MQTAPSLSASLGDQFAQTAAEVTESLSGKLELDDSNSNQMEDRVDGEFEFEAGKEDDEEEEDNEDFSFVFNDANKSPISPDDAFQDGQIRPVFPLFDRQLLAGDDSVPSEKDLPLRPQVRKVFIEAPTETEETETEATGPYCAWSKKAVEASPESCKKSSSTGFSKLWRFRDLYSRSNSDGRDAFVFLNGSPTTSAKKEDKVEKTESSLSEKKKPAVEVKVNVNAGGSKAKAKKAEKVEKSSLSAHYARNRALKEEDRRRSYLPYRPELVGFFTNVNGGLSRNVHPF
ncbi:uncharacterized protein LOC132303058 [Cornus florida]|uniref:uncharacterized protein LOC132303058 n=1 Tax=Cornus florida TaxID=4283 RepID=UPI00289F0A32|nr:uncharacterized protein LOC132303058 [Cornus florida]